MDVHRIYKIVISDKMRGKAALMRIKPQFPKSPEGSLMYEIIAQAIMDLFDKKEARNARRYLTNEMPHAELCGVKSEWITNTLIKLELI